MIRLAQGRAVDGSIGLGLFAVAGASVLFFAPWRHPAIRMWKLMLPLYLVLFASVARAVWTWGELEQSGLNWWSFFWILPCLIPLWTVGGRR